MKLRDALGAAPDSMASNPNPAPGAGYGVTVTATRLADGRVLGRAYLFEREWFEREYLDADTANDALYGDWIAASDQWEIEFDAAELAERLGEDNNA